jgi:hypothetical protein
MKGSVTHSPNLIRSRGVVGQIGCRDRGLSIREKRQSIRSTLPEGHKMNERTSQACVRVRHTDKVNSYSHSFVRRRGCLPNTPGGGFFFQALESVLFRYADRVKDAQGVRAATSTEGRA